MLVNLTIPFISSSTNDREIDCSKQERKEKAHCVENRCYQSQKVEPLQYQTSRNLVAKQGSTHVLAANSIAELQPACHVCLAPTNTRFQPTSHHGSQQEGKGCQWVVIA